MSENYYEKYLDSVANPSQSPSSEPLLEIKNLHTYFTTRRGIVKAVNGV